MQRKYFILFRLLYQNATDWVAWKQVKFIFSQICRLEVQNQGTSTVRLWKRHSSRLQTADFSLRPQTMEWARELCAVSPTRQQSHPRGLHPQDWSTSQRARFLTLSHWAAGFQHVNLGRDTNIQTTVGLVYRSNLTLFLFWRGTAHELRMVLTFFVVK